MSIEEEKVSFSLEVNVEEALTKFRQLQTVLYRTIGIFERMGLSPEARALANNIQRMITLFNMLRLAAIAAHTAMGPLGWTLAAIAIVETGFYANDLVMELT